MTDWHARSTAALMACVLFFGGAMAVRAMMGLSDIAEGKANAGEVFEVKILKATIPHGTVGKYPVLYRADVQKVVRTNSGVKAGDEIKVYSYCRENNVKFEGPKAPSLLRSGWTGIAYLNSRPVPGEYDIAVYGYSFEKTKKNTSSLAQKLRRMFGSSKAP